MPSPDGEGGTPAGAPGAPPTPAVVDTGGSGAPSSVSVEHDGELCRVGGTLDFGTAREALEAVAPLLERGAVSRIDLGGVARSNSAGLALMIEWLGVARRAGHPLAFENVPDGLRQLAGVCQVDALLHAPA